MSALAAAAGVDPTVQVALIGGIVTILGALIAIGGALLVQGGRHGTKLDKVEHGINHIDEEPDPDDGPTTIGQLVKQIDSKVDTAAVTNSQAHDGFARTLDAQGELGRSTSRRVDVNTAALGDLRHDLDSHNEIEVRIEAKIDGVMGEVETGGDRNKIGALAEADEGRRIESDIPKDERTTHEQEGVDRLHDQ